MNLAEATQRIAWLDEAHSADQQLLTELRKQVSAQSTLIHDLTRRLETLTDELTRTQGELSRFDQLEVTLVQTRDQLVQRVADETGSRLSTEEKARERDAAQTAHLSELSRLVQVLQDGMAQAQVGLTQLPVRVDEQVAQAAAHARLVESLEARLTQAQSRAVNLEARLGQQTDQVAHLLRQLQEVESRLTLIQTQLIRFPQVEDAMVRVKDELAALVKEQETAWRGELANFAELRRRERELDGQPITAILRQLEILTPLQEHVQRQTVENQRVTQALHQLETNTAALAAALDQRTEHQHLMEERLRRESARVSTLEQQAGNLAESTQAQGAHLGFLDEQALRNAKRFESLDLGVVNIEQAIREIPQRLTNLAKLIDNNRERLDAFEPEIPPIKSQNAEQADRIRSLEGWARRIADKIDELDRLDPLFQETRSQLVTQMQIHTADVARQLETWVADLAQHREWQEGQAKEMKRYTEMYDWARNSISTVDELSKKLAHHQQELADWHRLETDKQKKALEVWEAEWTEQWNLFLKQRAWDWGEQSKMDRQHTERIDQLETWHEQNVVHCDDLSRRIKDQDRIQFQRTADLWRAFEVYVKHNLSDLKKWIGEVEEARIHSLRDTTPPAKSQAQIPKVGPESKTSQGG